MKHQRPKQEPTPENIPFTAKKKQKQKQKRKSSRNYKQRIWRTICLVINRPENSGLSADLKSLSQQIGSCPGFEDGDFHSAKVGVAQQWFDELASLLKRWDGNAY
ncbi:uncharacterized protein [Aristolochia californica]|uniref:uncharacterized protein n=1 Tax=Aristolochia californica TaxID=171875 RepID=UPI0035DA3F3C